MKKAKKHHLVAETTIITSVASGGSCTNASMKMNKNQWGFESTVGSWNSAQICLGSGTNYFLAFNPYIQFAQNHYLLTRQTNGGGLYGTPEVVMLVDRMVL